MKSIPVLNLFLRPKPGGQGASISMKANPSTSIALCIAHVSCRTCSVVHRATKGAPTEAAKDGRLTPDQIKEAIGGLSEEDQQQFADAESAQALAEAT